MGRTPDHVAGFFAAMPRCRACSPAGGQKFADNVVAFYEYMRDNHIYASYAIVPPQIDRSKPAHKQSDPTLYAGVVKERDDGIVISGAQQLATGGPLSDYIHLSCIHPLQPGDENYANCVAIPVAAEGVKLYPRRRSRAPAARSTIRCRAGSTNPTATWSSTTCSCRGSTFSSTATSKSRATSGGRRRRISSATIRRRSASDQAALHGGTGASA